MLASLWFHCLRTIRKSVTGSATGQDILNTKLLHSNKHAKKVRKRRVETEREDGMAQ